MPFVFADCVEKLIKSTAAVKLLESPKPLDEGYTTDPGMIIHFKSLE